MHWFPQSHIEDIIKVLGLKILSLDTGDCAGLAKSGIVIHKDIRVSSV
jgi:hypothetical protein